MKHGNMNHIIAKYICKGCQFSSELSKLYELFIYVTSVKSLATLWQGILKLKKQQQNIQRVWKFSNVFCL